MFTNNDVLIQTITELSSKNEGADITVVQLSKEYDNLDIEDSKIRVAKTKKINEIQKAKKQIDDFKKQKRTLEDKCNDIEDQ